jgi:drug/metabolite transporter (DMT)-like permease
METIIDNPNTTKNRRTTAGVIILIIGSVLLINQLDLFFIPHWLFSWPMWIIAYGAYMGGKYNFRKPIWAIMILLGTAFLLTENIANADRIVWPVAIIGAGLWMVLKHKKNIADTPYKESSFKEL